MKSSGTPAASRGQTPNPPTRNVDQSAGVPELVKSGLDFTAYGLRKGAGGYTVCRVDVTGPMALITELREAEPQRAVAFAYLEQAVEEAYIRERG
jgi:hypothetical protein